MKFDRQLLAANQRLNHYRRRLAEGLPANPETPAILNWLRQNRPSIHPLLPPALPLSPDNCIYFDLTVSDSRSPDRVEDFSADIRRRLQDKRARVGIGRYAENRHCYQSEVFQNQSEARTLHIGVDVFVPAMTLLHAPLDATVYSLQNNRNKLDYGPTVILQHTIDRHLVFYSLYGHLAARSLEHLSSGEKIAAGQAFAEVGESSENGGWPPHVHVQLISDMLDWHGDYPGVVTNAEAQLWLSVCPDPSHLLHLPPQTADNIVSLV